MGNRKGNHCDKLVTTVCMLCILCAPHSHCSAHDPQQPRVPFHHHGRAKMSRPPDVSENLIHVRNDPLEVWKSKNLDSHPLTIGSDAIPSNLSTPNLSKVIGTLYDHTSENSSFRNTSYSKHFVPHKRSAATPSLGHSYPSGAAPHHSASVSRNGGRLRRSGDRPTLPITGSQLTVEWSPFLEEIFKEFGDGKVITVEGFKKMLSSFGAKKPTNDALVNADSRRVGFDAEVAAQEGLVSEKAFADSPCPASGVKDGRMTFKLPKNVSFSQHAIHSNTSSSSSQWHCLTAPEILSVADISEKGDVNRSEFVHRLCPALVYGALGQAESWIQEPQPSPSLTHKDHHSHEISKDGEVDSTLVVLPSNDPKVWLYASLSVIVISLCGLLGVAVIPVMQKVFYHQLLQFLVALAVGTLCGDALLHLLPHAMGPLGHHDHHHSHQVLHSELSKESDNHDANMWKGLGAMLGLVFFFTTERCLTLVGDWRKKWQRHKKPMPSRVRVMREAGPSSAVESGATGQVLNSGADVLLGSSACGSNSPRIGLSGGSHSVGEKLCKHKYSAYPYCYGEITTGEIVNDSSTIPAADEKPSNLDKKSRQRRRQNGCNESIAESGDDKLEKLMVRDGSGGFVKSPIEAIGRGYLESHPKENEGGEERKEDDEEEEGGDGGNSYTVILREHERPHHGHSHAHGHVHSAPESISSVAWMVVMGDGLHNLTDGMAIGAAFAAGIAGGFSTAVAVFCHELPHELGDFAVLLKAGMTAKQAVFYNLLSSLLCYFGMILGIFLGDTESATQWIFAAAAGMFLYIALVDMIPELTTSHSKESGSLFQSSIQLLGLMCGVGVMLLIALYENDLKDIFRGEDMNTNSKHPH